MPWQSTQPTQLMPAQSASRSGPCLHGGPPSKRSRRGGRRGGLAVRAEADELIQPVVRESRAFGPATVANLGPGFDCLGCAVEGVGDTVTASVLPDRPGEVEVVSVSGDGGRLPLDPTKNTASIAAAETLRLLGRVGCGVSLHLNKGLPLGSGLGSSAASAAAAIWAVNSLFGDRLARELLIGPGLVSEAAVSGQHADNIAPAILGSFVLVRSCLPLDVQRLTLPEGAECWLALVNPLFEAPTAEMRAALPEFLSFKQHVHNSAASMSLVTGILQGDIPLLGRSLDSDRIVEPVRGPLIPGFQAVKAAATAAGAYGCTISGAGPTCVAVVPSEEAGAKVAEAMSEAFKRVGHLEVNSVRICKVATEGARTL